MAPKEPNEISVANELIKKPDVAKLATKRAKWQPCFYVCDNKIKIFEYPLIHNTININML